MRAGKILAAAAAAIVTMCGAALLQPGQMVEAAQTGTVASKSALEDNQYNQYSGDIFTGVFGKDNGAGGASEFKVVRADGSTTTVNNSNGQIRELYPYSSYGTGFQLLKGISSDNKQAILNLDGSYFAGLQGWHDEVRLLDEAKDLSYYYRDGNVIHFCAPDGTEILTYTVEAEAPEGEALNISVRGFGEYYAVTFRVHEVDENHEYRGGKVLVLDKNGGIKLEGRGGFAGDLSVCLYGENFEQTYYDRNLNVVPDWLGWQELPAHNELAPNRKTIMLDGNEPCPEAITAAGLKGWAKFTIDGKNYYEVYNEEGNLSLVDENANVIIPVGTYVSGIGDHMFAVRNEAGYYNIVDLKGEVAGTVNPSPSQPAPSNPAPSQPAANVVKDTAGNTKASVVPAGSTDMTFFMDAANGVVPDGSAFKVESVEKESTAYKNAQTVLNGVVNPDVFRVYDINLWNGNAKIQPNGKLSISITIPNEFDRKKVAAYRINDDNTYTELKSVVTNGLLIFETDHFSTYVITEKTAASVKSPETGKNAIPVGFLLIPAVICGMGAVVYGKKAARRA